MSGVQRAKGLGAGLAFVAGSPMACVVHVLIAGALGAKSAGADLTFRPMAVLVHVVVAVIWVVKSCGTGLAFVHCVIRLEVNVWAW